MTIVKKQEGAALTIYLEGRLDTSTAPQLDAEVENLDGVTKLVLDMKKLVYLSSAGLRSILSLQKRMSRQGSMVVRNVCDVIMEVFEMTGFTDILTIE
ncbi:putative antagonist protein [Oscillibacter valericigenes Sjm18-20]|nr:putative antagonist protein [Oscillibacter valericigenes Sjm18-20]